MSWGKRRIERRQRGDILRRFAHLTTTSVIAVGACSPASRGGDPSPPVPAPAPVRVAADSTPKVPVVELPPGASQERRLRVGDLNTVQTFVVHVPLPSDSGECGPRERSASGEGTVAMLYYPSRAEPVAVSMVLIATNGRFIRFTDRRGGLRISPPPGLTRQQRDSVILDFRRREPRTTITLEYLTGRASVVNDGANLPRDGFTAPISYIAHNPRYDSPDGRAQMIVARCR